MDPNILALQIAAEKLGYDPGPLDGLWGARTRAGLNALLDARFGRWGDPVENICDALIAFGWLEPGQKSRVWSDAISAALIRLIDAGGAHNVGPGVILPPNEMLFGPHKRSIFQGRAGYLVRLFVLHTTATTTDWWKGKSNRQMFEDVRSWHLGRGWRDIGYHGLICPDGEVIEGRAWTEIGAHVREANRGSLGYAMVPVKTITQMGRPEDFYTQETLESLRAVIAKACHETQIRRIDGHNEYANKLCPGFRVIEEDWAPTGWREAA